MKLFVWFGDRDGVFLAVAETVEQARELIKSTDNRNDDSEYVRGKVEDIIQSAPDMVIDTPCGYIEIE